VSLSPSLSSTSIQSHNGNFWSGIRLDSVTPFGGVWLPKGPILPPIDAGILTLVLPDMDKGYMNRIPTAKNQYVLYLDKIKSI
jgi:hypothetical protein